MGKVTHMQSDRFATPVCGHPGSLLVAWDWRHVTCKACHIKRAAKPHPVRTRKLGARPPRARA